MSDKVHGSAIPGSIAIDLSSADRQKRMALADLAGTHPTVGDRRVGSNVSFCELSASVCIDSLHTVRNRGRHVPRYGDIGAKRTDLSCAPVDNAVQEQTHAGKPTLQR
jgi:hypothetical protein